MKIEEVIKQLESILDHTRSMAASPDADNIWRKDIDALEFALTALRSMPETTKPGWISVKERLPNFGIPVLICWDGYTDIAEYRCGMVCPKWRTQHYGTVDLASVTHWMPLPEPPKED